ncbi:N-acyl homoserine lactonase family protein [Amycolatopsis keratiniphila]|uniref:N-acyl homoserine lactonase family protein n=1 Tax=Amycolatopsis keratiniphila TaxID=129921 RepID=UPI0007ACCB38|nr:N-acyl homoserine lactonase family protein [Amycolatopsis keratiniphila]
MSGTIKHLWALDAPTIATDCGLFQLGTGGTQLAVPIPTFLIEHDLGLLMFDSGLDSNAAGDPARAYGPLAEAFDIRFPEDHRLDTQLESIGFTTKDVRQIVISHLHFDHTGGLDLFAGAQGFIGADELRYARTPRALDAAMFREHDLDAASRIDWLEVPRGYDHDVFGDGSVTILSLPGHTLGTLGLQVRLPDGKQIVLSSDAAHLRSNIDKTTGMPLDVSNPDKENGLRKLKLLASRPDTTVWVNHDPDDWKLNRPNGRQIA